MIRSYESLISICSTSTAAVDVKGISYKTKGIVVVGSYLGVPEVGRTQDIVVQNSAVLVYFVIEVINTLQLYDYY